MDCYRCAVDLKHSRTWFHIFFDFFHSILLLLIRTLTKLRRNKTALDIDNVVDMSPPLVKEGSSGFANSTSWSSISIKHTNGEHLTDEVDVDSISKN